MMTQRLWHSWFLGALLFASLAACNRQTEKPAIGGKTLTQNLPICPDADSETPVTACLGQCDRVCLDDHACGDRCAEVCKRGVFKYGPGECVGTCGTDCAPGDEACLDGCFAHCAGEPAAPAIPTLPAPVITAAPLAVTSDNAASFGFACAADACGAFECRVDADPWRSCISPVTFLNLYDGGHAFEVREAAQSFCAVAVAASYTWTVNMGLPPTAPPATWPVPLTGQKVCFNDADVAPCPAAGSDYYGQDAQYATGATSFVVNGNGTVTDGPRGLMWQRQDDGVSRNRQNAVAYCNALSLAGYTDWRLPGVQELMSIVDYGVLSPSIDSAVFPGTKASFYWAATLSPDTADDGWVVLFSFGTVLANLVTADVPFTRCVRSLP